MKCFVFNCFNKSNKNIDRSYFFPFPNDKKLLKQWLAFCCRESERKKIWAVCSAHFNPEDLIGATEFSLGLKKRMYLKPTAVPCKYLHPLQPDEVKWIEDYTKKHIEMKPTQPNLPSLKDTAVEVDEVIELSEDENVSEIIQPAFLELKANQHTTTADSGHLLQIPIQLQVMRLKMEIEVLQSDNECLRRTKIDMENEHAYKINILSKTLREIREQLKYVKKNQAIILNTCS